MQKLLIVFSRINHSLVSCCFSCLRVSILSCLFLTYIWNIQWRLSLYIRILCGLLSCDSSSMCKKCCVFTRHYILDEDSERPFDYEPSLLPKGFSSTWVNPYIHNTFLFLPDLVRDHLKMSILSLANRISISMQDTSAVKSSWFEEKDWLIAKNDFLDIYFITSFG